MCVVFFFFKQKTAYEMRISDWSSDVCSSDLLVRDGVSAEGEGDRLVEEQNAYLAQEFEAGLSYKPNKADWLEGMWSGIKVASGAAGRGESAVDVDQLTRFGSRLCAVPDRFSLHRKLPRHIARRRNAVVTDEGCPVR